MIGIVNADQVAQAYTVPLSGAVESIRYYDQLAQRRQARREALAAKKGDDDLAKQRIIAKSFEGTDIGTGTPWDYAGHAHVAEAKDKVMQFMKDNQNATPSELWAATTDATAGIKEGLQNAVKIDKAAQDWAAKAKAGHPQLDYNKAYKYAQSKYFYDDKNNFLTTPNTAYNLDLDMANPTIRGGLLDPAASSIAMQKELADNFKPTTFPTKDGLLQWKGRPYMGFDNKPLTEDVPVSQPSEQQVMPLAALYGGAPPDARVPFANPTVTLQGTPTSLLTTMKSRPALADGIIAEVSRLKAQYPEEMKGATPQQVEQIAAHNILMNHASYDGYEPPSPTEMAKYLQQKQHQQVTEANQAAHLKIARQGNSRAQAKADKAAVDEKVSPYSILTQAQKDPSKLDTQQRALLDANTHKGLFGGNHHVDVTDVNGLAQKDYIKDPTNGLRSKISSYRNPMTNQMVYEVTNYGPEKDKFGTKTGNIIPVGKRVITGKQYESFHYALEPQLSRNTKSQQAGFDETLNSTDSFPDGSENFSDQ